MNSPNFANADRCAKPLNRPFNQFVRKITKHTLLVASFVFGQLLFSSCHNPNNMEIICINDFTKASALAHSRPTRKSALDSSLTIINRCLQCIVSGSAYSKIEKHKYLHYSPQLLFKKVPNRSKWQVYPFGILSR